MSDAELPDYLLVDVSHLIQDGVSCGQVVLHHDIPAAYRDGFLPDLNLDASGVAYDKQTRIFDELKVKHQEIYNSK